MAKIAIHAYISGRVQGVGYRYSTVQQAKRLGLNGWVRNMLDGRVEALFEGEEGLVNQMLSWCQEGPSMAYVTNIETYKKTYSGQFYDFSVTG